MNQGSFSNEFYYLLNNYTAMKHHLTRIALYFLESRKNGPREKKVLGKMVPGKLRNEKS